MNESADAPVPHRHGSDCPQRRQHQRRAARPGRTAAAPVHLCASVCICGSILRSGRPNNGVLRPGRKEQESKMKTTDAHRCTQMKLVRLWLPGGMQPIMARSVGWFTVLICVHLRSSAVNSSYDARSWSIRLARKHQHRASCHPCRQMERLLLGVALARLSAFFKIPHVYQWVRCCRPICPTH